MENFIIELLSIIATVVTIAARVCYIKSQFRNRKSHINQDKEP